MAGDWMKLELSTPEKPEVLAMAIELSADVDLIVGKLFRVWRWFDEHTDNGTANVSQAALDRVVGMDGITDAMHAVGWLRVKGDTITLPNFDRHNGTTAKRRAEDMRRKQSIRGRQGGSAKSVRKVSAICPQSVREDSDVLATKETETETEIDKSNNASALLGGVRENSDSQNSEPIAIGTPVEFITPSQARSIASLYPLQLAPGAAREAVKRAVHGLVIAGRFDCNANAMAFLMQRVIAYAKSPAGQPPPKDSRDFRPAPARWFDDERFDESEALWGRPNGETQQGQPTAIQGQRDVMAELAAVEERDAKRKAAAL